MITNRRILLLTPFESWPLSQGSIVRTHYVAKKLCQHNQLWLACREGDEVVTNLPLAGVITAGRHRTTQLFSLRYLWRLHQLIKQEEIDLIVVSQFWSGLLGLLLHWWSGLPLLFDNHNVEYLRLRRMGSPVWLGAKGLEYALCQAAVVTLVVSTVDRDYLITHLNAPAARLVVIPNGAEVAQMGERVVDGSAVRRQLNLPLDQPLALFFGSLTHRPNAQALDLIVAEIAPRLEAQGHELQLGVAGLGHEAYRQSHTLPPNVHLVGFVPDMVALIKAVDVVMAPILAGSGTRFKIIEGIACQRRVVSTTLGAEGLDPAVLGAGLVLADDWESFTQALVSAVALPRECPPPATFEQQYDWANILAPLAELL